jgi:hypothetical protein
MTREKEDFEWKRRNDKRIVDKNFCSFADNGIGKVIVSLETNCPALEWFTEFPIFLVTK